MRTPRVSTVVGGAFAIWATVVGLERLHDNSFLTHVATGRYILAHGVPTRDPYTFTALGRPWVVESWLAEVLYRGLENLAGGHGLQVMHAVLCATLAGLGWVLTRPARQLGGGSSPPGRCWPWAPGTGRRGPCSSPWCCSRWWRSWSRPTGALPGRSCRSCGCGSTSHGSWPLGLAYLVLRMVGRRIDRHPLGRLPRLTGFAVAGAALGAVNPIGLRLVAYPLTVITHHQAFAHIVEWQTPSFSDPVNVAFLVEVLLAVVLLVARRGTVEDVLVTAAFSAAALLASRNVPVAALLVIPVLARGLAGLGTIAGAKRGIVPAIGLGVLVALGVGLTAGAVQRPAYDLSLYPVSEGQLAPEPAPGAGPGGDHRLRRELPRVPLRHPGRGLHRRPGRRLPARGREGLRDPAERGSGVAGGARRGTGSTSCSGPGPRPWPRSSPRTRAGPCGSATASWVVAVRNGHAS